MHHNSWSIDTDQRVIIAAVVIVKIFLQVLKFHFKKLNALKFKHLNCRIISECEVE